MELTAKELSDLEIMGASLFNYRECAIALEKDEVQFADMMINPKAPAFKAYWKGMLSTKLKHVQSVFELAQRGSSPAQQSIQKMIDDLKGKI
jgi:hypothetical protein